MSASLQRSLFVDLVGSTESFPAPIQRWRGGAYSSTSQCLALRRDAWRSRRNSPAMPSWPRSESHSRTRTMPSALSRAALGILAGVRELSLEARIGIESARCLRRAATRPSQPRGVNIAARLQQAADVDGILIAVPGPTGSRSGPSSSRRGSRRDSRPTRSVWAWRVICMIGGRAQAATRRLRSSAGAELELLENTYARACARSPRATLHDLRLARSGEEPSPSSSSAARGSDRALWPGASLRRRRDVLRPRRHGQVAAGISDDDPLDDCAREARECCPTRRWRPPGARSGVLEA